MSELPTFDMDAFYDALDERRQTLQLNWYELADRLWEQSAELNAARPDDHPLCGGAVSRQRERGTTSCQYALFMLRWLGRPPEDFLAGPAVDVGETRLPAADGRTRLRFDLAALHEALQQERSRRRVTWAVLADEIGCTPARLSNLRRAKQAEMDLVMRVTQHLGRPAAEFVVATDW